MIWQMILNYSLNDEPLLASEVGKEKSVQAENNQGPMEGESAVRGS